ncbi:MAG: SDR family NAD(P)-dependent oxidoreductase [Actinobacteria bacterium]|nr:SDR family NAD(P)-dependent oxidoreductase [Actinomycetota bacterium]
MSLSHSGKTALITGATSGIGLYTARELVSAGWRVVGTARTPAQADQLLRDVPGVEVLVADFTEPESASNLISQTLDLLGQAPYALVNNAGFAAPGAIEDVAPAYAAEQVRVNLFIPAELIRGFLPSMRSRGSGRIVNISSVSGRVAAPFLGWYSASKFALEALSDALRVELTGSGINVSLIEPTSFSSNIWSKAGTQLPTTGPHQKIYQKAARLVHAEYPEPTPVARVIRDAIESDAPRTRYLVGKGTGAIPYVRLLPAKMIDAFVAITFGLKRPPLLMRLLTKRSTRG